MKISAIMSRDVEIASPDDTVQNAAQRMARIDSGVLPVGENDRLVGMITDRDIAIRAAAEGKDPSQTKVRDVMSNEVKFCYEDENVDHISEDMSELQIRRLPVISREKRLVGIVSLGDIATEHKPATAGAALRGVSRAGGAHSQSAHAGGKPKTR
jgi:CBS domain-containing protein